MVGRGGGGDGETASGGPRAANADNAYVLQRLFKVPDGNRYFIIIIF